MYYQVLLVDDEEIVCNGLRRFLDWESCGYQVTDVAHSVDQALSCLEQRPIDLVITDIRMPVRNGLQLLEAIQEDYPDIRTIVLSGYGEFEYAQKALRLGASDFLTKPVNFGELKHLLASVRSKLEAERIEVFERQEYRQMKFNLLLNNLAKGYADGYTGKDAQVLEPYLSYRNYYLIRLRFLAPSSRQDGIAAFKSYWSYETQDFSKHDGTVFPFNNELNEFAFLYFPTEESPKAVPFIETLQSQLDRFQAEGMIGLSDIHNGASYVQAAYKEAGKTLQSLYIYGKRRAAMYQEIKALPFFENQLDESFGMDLLRMLSSPQQLGSLAAYILCRIDAIAGQEELSVAEVQAFCIQVMLMLNQHLQSFRESKLITDEHLHPPIRDLLLASHLSGIKESMSDWLERLAAEIAKNGNDSESGNVIANVKRYIQEHYAENITLNSLSSVFYLHPIYLSRLFKEKTGVNFVEYVTEVRMNIAKELLLNPRIKVYDICQMVGYESPRYFTKLFKNATGITPKSYREAGNARN